MRLRQTVAARELPLERRITARYLAAAAAQLGAAPWDEAWQRGLQLGTEEAIAHALDRGEP